MKEKNPVEVFLDNNGANYELVYFPAEEEAQGARKKAAELGVPIYKTLVLKGNKTGPVIALVPLDAHLDYKKTAKATGNRKVGFPPMEYVLETTGYVHGANTPIGIAMSHPDYGQIFDSSIKQHFEVVVSAGLLGVGVKIPVDELIVLVKPFVAEITAKESE